MDMLKKIFPLSFAAKELKEFAVILAAYAAVKMVCQFLIGLLVEYPLVQFICSILGAAVGLYTLVGIILTVLLFTKVIE